MSDKFVYQFLKNNYKLDNLKSNKKPVVVTVNFENLLNRKRIIGINFF